MIAMLMTAGLLAGDAYAGGSPKLIRYDSYADDGDFIFGAFFDGMEGLGKFNCMAQVYSFDDADFPLVPTELRMFWAGEGMWTLVLSLSNEVKDVLGRWGYLGASSKQ